MVYPCSGIGKTAEIRSQEKDFDNAEVEQYLEHGRSHEMKILAISPYLEFTKVALFENYNPLWAEVQLYDAADLSQFPTIISQEDFRVGKIRELIASKDIPLNGINAFAATGGVLHPLEGGTYHITMEMLQDLTEAKYGESPANLGAALAIRLATMAGSRYAYIVDPPVFDEMSEVAHMTGLPGLRRRAGFHALNQRAVVHREALNMDKPLGECNFIVCHLDDAVSITAFTHGKFVEANDINNASGVMSMSHCGDLPPGQLIDLCFSGEYTAEELKSRIVSESGFKGLLGVENFNEVIRQVRTGERKAILAFEAFMLQLVKAIGACAGVLDGQVDAVILTGEFVNDEFFRGKLIERISWIAPLVAYPGNDELLALVEGTIRVLRGQEEPKNYA